MTEKEAKASKKGDHSPRLTFHKAWPSLGASLAHPNPQKTAAKSRKPSPLAGESVSRCLCSSHIFTPRFFVSTTAHHPTYYRYAIYTRFHCRFQSLCTAFRANSPKKSGKTRVEMLELAGQGSRHLVHIQILLLVVVIYIRYNKPPLQSLLTY